MRLAAKMDKLSLISGALFLAADIFAVASLAMPDWIVTEVTPNPAYPPCPRRWAGTRGSG